MVNQRGSTEEMDAAIIIDHDGDTWRIVGIGTRRDGKAYCHLASTTRKQRNGNNPIQIADWIDEAVIEAGRTQRGTGPDGMTNQQSINDILTTALQEVRRQHGLAAHTVRVEWTDTVDRPAIAVTRIEVEGSVNAALAQEQGGER